MNRLSQQTMRRVGFVSSRRDRRRRATFALHHSGSWLEVLEDRTLLSLDLNNVQNLKALAVSAVQNVSMTQEVATFNDTDSAAAAADFTASINWGDGTTTTGTITGSSGSFAVTGGHTYAGEGSDPLSITVTDTLNSGTLALSGSVTVAEGDTLTPHNVTFAATTGTAFIGTVARLHNVSRVEILPFHKLGAPKYGLLGIAFPLAEHPVASPELVSEIRERMLHGGLPVV